MESKKRTLFIVISVLIHILIMVAVILLTSRSAVGYKGPDTMYHVYRGEWVLNSIKDGDLWPLYNPIWYNGVELMRYWTPLAAYLMALCIQIGSLIQVESIAAFSGFAIYCGVIYLIGAISWTIIGMLKNRPYLGLVMGIMWFFMPQSLYVLFNEGNLPRALIMAVFPLMFHFLNEFLKEGGKGNFIGIAVTFFVMCSSHAGYTGMVAIACIIYLVIYRLCVFTGSDRLQRSGKRDLIALTAIIGGFLLCGIFLYPALNGGLVASGANRDETAKNFFQSIFITLDPVGKIKKGYPPAYFGIISFLLAIFGILAGKRRSRAGFITAIIIIFCTTETASPIIRSLPGGDLMWMMRFMQIASAMIVYSMLEWDSLKKPLVIAVTTLLAADCVISYDLFIPRDGITSMEAYFEAKGEEAPLDEAKDLTVNRLALMDGNSPMANGVFYLTDYNGGVNQAYGQGWEAASDATTIAMLNEAFDMGYYDFMFDRLLELGCDTILLGQASPESYPFNEDEAEASAAKAGYSIALEEGDWIIYHLGDVSTEYGTISEYDGIAIGSGAYYITMMFPSIDEASSEYIDDFTAEELSEYDIIYLDGFDYH
ncbi:MAG: hypothetical protein K5745_07740, partial [Saccharofermentans sp.]|nr:hypothetical protein [Saccharofermentans sp.]